MKQTYGVGLQHSNFFFNSKAKGVIVKKAPLFEGFFYLKH
jgi:hypothetical protein